MIKRIANLIIRGLCCLILAVIETVKRAIFYLKIKVAEVQLILAAKGIKGYLADQAGKGGMEALFGMALLGIVLIIFVFKAAPTMFESANEIATATGASAPDATSKSFMGMIPWIFIGILTVVIIMVMIRQTKGGGRRGG